MYAAAGAGHKCKAEATSKIQKLKNAYSTQTVSTIANTMSVMMINATSEHASHLHHAASHSAQTSSMQNQAFGKSILPDAISGRTSAYASWSMYKHVLWSFSLSAVSQSSSAQR